METSLKTGFAQIFSRCPRNLSCPKFGGAAAPLAPPARTPMLIDNTARKVPVARITVDTPYLKGQVEAQCLPDAIYDLIIGNVPGARPADEPDLTWQEACAVPTRSQAKKDGEVTL